jgi:hypothetical protein
LLAKGLGNAWCVIPKRRKIMKFRLLSAVFAPALLFGLAACDVDQTREGEMPDVEVEGGQLPEYDVDAPDVRVGTDTQRVIVPDIDVRRDTTR